MPADLRSALKAEAGRLDISVAALLDKIARESLNDNETKRAPDEAPRGDGASVEACPSTRALLLTPLA
jgi:hypothetical protein